MRKFEFQFSEKIEICELVEKRLTINLQYDIKFTAKYESDIAA